MARARSTQPAPGARRPGTLILRVEGPAAIEIQHLANVDLRARQPLSRLARGRADRVAPGPAAPRRARKPRPAIDPAAAARIAASLPEIADEI